MYVCIYVPVVYKSVFMFVYLCILMCVYVCVYVCMCLCVCVAGHLSSIEDQCLNTFTSSLSLLCPLCLSWFVLYSLSTPFMSFLPDESRLDWQPVAMRP